MKTKRFRITGMAWAFAVVLLAAHAGYAELKAEPASVTFTSKEQSATIALSKDGVPLPAKDIQGWELLASDHDYQFMLSYEKLEGALKITPNDRTEVGSFDLKINTTAGPVTVQVFTPLSEHSPDTLPALNPPVLAERITLEIAPTYYEGQTLRLNLPAAPERISSWTVNGKTVKEGPGETALAFTFKEPGGYEIRYAETQQKDGKTVIVAQAQARTVVSALPEVPWEVPVNVEVRLPGPEGYKAYLWRVDKQQASTEPVLVHTFKETGSHSVECVASTPTGGLTENFQRVRYAVTVKGK